MSGGDRTQWPMEEIGEAFQVVTGNTPPKSKKALYGDAIPLVKPPELADCEVLTAGDGLSEEGRKFARVAQPGSVLVSCIGNLGKIGLAGTELAFNQQINAIMPDAAKAVPKFLFYYCLSPQFVNQLEALASGTTVSIVNKSRFSTIKTPLPPLEEQKRIVAVLDQAFAALDRARALAEANLADAAELLSGVVETELELLGEPEPIGPHVDLLSGFAFKSKGYTDNSEDIRLIRGDNIVQGDFRWDRVKRWRIAERGDYAKYELARDDVLIAMDRTWVSAGIKYAVVNEAALPSLLVQRVARLRTRSSILPKFLAYCVGSKVFERYVLSIQTGLGVPHVSGKQIEDFKVPIPEVHVQEQIVEKLDAILAQCSRAKGALEEKLQALDDLRQSLLQKAFAGELT